MYIVEDLLSVLYRVMQKHHDTEQWPGGCVCRARITTLPQFYLLQLPHKPITQALPLLGAFDRHYILSYLLIIL